MPTSEQKYTVKVKFEKKFKMTRLMNITNKIDITLATFKKVWKISEYMIETNKIEKVCFKCSRTYISFDLLK